MPLFLRLSLILFLFAPAQASAQRADSPDTYVARVMDGPLRGFTFNKRLANGDADDTIMLFQRGNDVVIVGWTKGADRVVPIPASRMVFELYDENGQIIGEVDGVNNLVYMPLTKLPRFLVPTQANARLLIGASATRLPPAIRVKGPATVPVTVEFTNVLQQDFLLSINEGANFVALRPGETYLVQREVEVGRAAEPVPVFVGATGFRQKTEIEVTNPIRIRLTPDVKGALNLRITNPSGEAFRARAELRLIAEQQIDPLVFEVAMRRGQTTLDYQIPRATPGEIPFPLQVVLIVTVGGNDERDADRFNRDDDDDGEPRAIALAYSPATLFRGAGNFRGLDLEGKPSAYQAFATGDATLALSLDSPLEGLPNVDAGSLELLYRFQKPGGFVSIVPRNDAQRLVAGRPAALGLWIYGDGAGLTPSLVMRDATGQRFSFSGKPITWKSWEYVIIPLDREMRPPLTLESFFQLDNGKYPSFGRIYLNDATWIYEEELIPVVE